ncbi:hypothetical protein ACFO3O_08105 [Dokdonia ponticola]|uniref:T9SS type A sorting domain-containing protein n=1 Tax=Dokdonia ponticola TaxID=2041041 RepID=A0ABV9HUN4_9FLAO
MNKKSKQLKGTLPPMPGHKIYLNVNALQEGDYELKIMDKNKVIKKTTFKK